VSTPVATVTAVTVVLHLVPFLLGALLVADLVRQLRSSDPPPRQ
jgi:hypothetical protein